MNFFLNFVGILTIVAGPLMGAEKVASKGYKQNRTLYLSENLNGGAQIVLSDGSLYEIMPEDREMAAYWLTPVPIEISSSRDLNYPYLLRDTLTGAVIRGKKLEL